MKKYKYYNSNQKESEHKDYVETDDYGSIPQGSIIIFRDNQSFYDSL